jgi:signal transduction histidine kinase
MVLNHNTFTPQLQVTRREKMADIRVREAVQKAKETELSKSLHITEETMRAKQMLATMSHEIRSPLSGVLSMAEILATTKLDKEQYQLLEVMLSSGDLVLQLINDILDLSKVESGILNHMVLDIFFLSFFTWFLGDSELAIGTKYSCKNKKEATSTYVCNKHIYFPFHCVLCGKKVIYVISVSRDGSRNSTSNTYFKT